MYLYCATYNRHKWGKSTMTCIVRLQGPVLHCKFMVSDCYGVVGIQRRRVAGSPPKWHIYSTKMSVFISSTRQAAYRMSGINMKHRIIVSHPSHIKRVAKETNPNRVAFYWAKHDQTYLRQEIPPLVGLNLSRSPFSFTPQRCPRVFE